MRFLNHVGPLVYREGDQQRARGAFELLGCRITGEAGKYLVVDVDEGGSPDRDNVLYACPWTPEQRDLEAALAVAIRQSPALQRSVRDYQRLVERTAFEAPHFGLRVDSWREVTEIVERVDGERGDLAGRVSVASVSPPGEQAAGFGQAFIWTDVFALGLLVLGQFVELQVSLDT